MLGIDAVLRKGLELRKRLLLHHSLVSFFCRAASQMRGGFWDRPASDEGQPVELPRSSRRRQEESDMANPTMGIECPKKEEDEEGDTHEDTDNEKGSDGLEV